MKLNSTLSIAFFAFLVLWGCNTEKQGSSAFEIKDGDFLMKGKSFQILSGELHYLRIPHQYWRHRLQMIKALGLNTVATYVFWNAHETEPDVWDFEGDKNLAEFIKIAGEEGLYVILRPGPYACAEWEFGGYPWWLQNVEGLELRRDNDLFLEYTKKYLNRLYQEVGQQQITQGGPIIMVQVENEFGSYVSQRTDIPVAEHISYNTKIKDQLVNAGFEVPFFTSDGTWLFEGGAIKGVLPTANGENNVNSLKKAVDQFNNGKGPYMVAEFYPGWLAHWNEPHPFVDPSSVARQTEIYLQNNISFNFYMAHGGTNFGFTSGANYDKDHDIQPDLTSYDYDAPVSEAGWVTPKYDSIRDVISKYLDYKLPPPPKQYPVIEIPFIKFSTVTNLLEWGRKDSPVKSNNPLTFEQLNQGYGYVLYSRHFNQPISGPLEIKGLRDFATVYVDGCKVGELNRYDRSYSIDVDIPFNSTLDILVENMGRINYGAEIVHNTKGIISPVTINGFEITGDWEMYKLPMNQVPVIESGLKLNISNVNYQKDLIGKPVLYIGNFHLDETGDTFINMERWGKGIVYINGHHIGRYWKVGPQQTLFIPGVWLNTGENSIVVFEQLNDELILEVSTAKNPVLTSLK